MESEKAEHPVRSTAEAVRVVGMPGDRLVTIKVTAKRTGGACSLFEVEVGPGGGEGPHVQHREDECLYVIEGRFGFVVEGVRTEAGPGTHLYVPKGALHAYENVGGRTGRLLALHTPGGSHELFLEEAGESAFRGEAVTPRTERPEAAGFAEVAAKYGIELCDADGLHDNKVATPSSAMQKATVLDVKESGHEDTSK